MSRASQFRPAGPLRLRSKRWVEDYNEVKALGAKDGSERTPDQTATALFWQPLAGTVWLASIRRLAAEQGLDLASSAHFQAAAFAAFADLAAHGVDYVFWRYALFFEDRTRKPALNFKERDE